MNDEDNVTGGDLAKSITFEVAANTLLDKYSGLLLAAPDPSLISKGIYALANVGGSAAINYFAQRMRGGKFNLGELLTAGGLSLIPGGVQAKTLSRRIAKGAAKGAGTGALQVTGESLINTGKPPELQEVAAGAVAIERPRQCSKAHDRNAVERHTVIPNQASLASGHSGRQEVTDRVYGQLSEPPGVPLLLQMSNAVLKRGHCPVDRAFN